MKDVVIVAIVSMFIIVGMFAYFATGGTFQVAGGTGAGGADVVTGKVGTCGDDNIGAIMFEYKNDENTSANALLNVSYRVYKLNGEVEGFTGTTGTSSASAVSNYTGECGYTYRIYAIPANTWNLGGKIDVALNGEQTSVQVIHGAAQRNLVFKVYDNDAPGNVYANVSDTAYAPNATVFMSSANNSTEKDVSTGGFIDYTITFNTNGTLTAVSRYNDQSLLVGLDLQTLTQWSVPDATAVTVNSVQTTKLDNVPSRISSDGFDVAYEFGGPPIITDTPSKLHIIVRALPSVNPTDHIRVGVFTKGYFVRTMSDDMSSGYFKDDDSRTYVYGGYNLIDLAIS